MNPMEHKNPTILVNHARGAYRRPYRERYRRQTTSGYVGSTNLIGY